MNSNLVLLGLAALAGPSFCGIQTGGGKDAGPPPSRNARCDVATDFATRTHACSEYKNVASLELSRALCEAGGSVWTDDLACDTGAVGGCRVNLPNSDASGNGTRTDWYYAGGDVMEIRDLLCNSEADQGVIVDASGTVVDTDTSDNIKGSCTITRVGLVNASCAGPGYTIRECQEAVGVYSKNFLNLSQTDCQNNAMSMVCNSVTTSWSLSGCSRSTYLGGCKQTAYNSKGTYTIFWTDQPGHETSCSPGTWVTP